MDIQVLSWDGKADLEVLALNAASTALLCSDVPWSGPVGAIRLTLKGRGIVAHPTQQDLQETTAQLLYAGTAHGAVLLSAEVS